MVMFSTGGPNMTLYASMVFLFALYFAKQLFDWLKKRS
jgi:hypothetical protein